MHSIKRQHLIVGGAALGIIAFVALVLMAIGSSNGTSTVTASGATSTPPTPDGYSTPTPCTSGAGTPTRVPSESACPQPTPGVTAVFVPTPSNAFVEPIVMNRLAFDNAGTALIDTAVVDGTDATITVKNVNGLFAKGGTIGIDSGGGTAESVTYSKYVSSCAGGTPPCNGEATDTGTFTVRMNCNPGGITACRGVQNGAAASGHSTGTGVVSGRTYFLCLTRQDVDAANPPNGYVGVSACENTAQPQGPPISSGLETGPDWFQPLPGDVIFPTRLHGGSPIDYLGELIAGGHIPLSGVTDGAGNLVLGFAGGACLGIDPGGAKINVQLPLGTAHLTPATITGTITNQVWGDATCAGTAESTANGPVTVTGLDSTHDQDGDGCTDFKELGGATGLGGNRDPWNHFDYFEPTHNHQVRVDDILAVVHQFFKDDDTTSPGLFPFAFDAQTQVNNGAGVLVGDTSITVDDTTGATATGTLIIDAERMRYTGKTATSFTGVTRGVSGTVAATHADNATVTAIHYDPDTDRAALGPAAYNLQRGDGKQRVDDILAVVKQFFNDC